MQKVKSGGDNIRSGNVLYPVLEKAIKERKIRKKEIAAFIGIQQRTLSHKLNGRLGFSLDEAVTIQAAFFEDIPVSELFRKRRNPDE